MRLLLLSKSRVLNADPRRVEKAGALSCGFIVLSPIGCRVIVGQGFEQGLVWYCAGEVFTRVNSTSCSSGF